ncbi:MAG: hypothetical protein J4473_04015 [Candidatus Aenigmarchaeota archaeon]|nr:hypothetical protein [Candidatus Aenigmarchaeota archaeon]
MMTEIVEVDGKRALKTTLDGRIVYYQRLDEKTIVERAGIGNYNPRYFLRRKGRVNRKDYEFIDQLLNEHGL